MSNIGKKTCRICLNPAEPEYPLFTPCKCTGTMGFIHQDCLLQWQEHLDRPVRRCETCGTKIRLSAPSNFGWGFIANYVRCFVQENYYRLLDRLKRQPSWLVKHYSDYILFALGAYLALNLISLAVHPLSNAQMPDFGRNLPRFGPLSLNELANFGLLCSVFALAHTVIETGYSHIVLSYDFEYFLNVGDLIDGVFAEIQATENDRAIEKNRANADTPNRDYVTVRRDVLILLIGFAGTFLHCVCVGASRFVLAYFLGADVLELRPHMLPQLLCLCLSISIPVANLYITLSDFDEDMEGKSWHVSWTGLRWARNFAVIQIAVLVLVPYAYGMLGYYAATGVFACPDLGTPLGLGFWLGGSVYRWGAEDAIFHMRYWKGLDEDGVNFSYLLSLYTQSLAVLVLLGLLFRGVLRLFQASEVAVFCQPLDFTLPLGQHFMWTMLILVALLTPVGNSQPLADVARVWLTDHVWFHFRKQFSDSRKIELRWTERGLAMLVYVVVPFVTLAVFPILVGRAAYFTLNGTLAVSDLLLWGTGLAIELPAMGWWLLKIRPRDLGSEDWYIESRAHWKESSVPNIRWRTLYFSLALWLVSFVTPAKLNWIGPDLVSRLIAIAWPNYWYRWMVLPLMVANMQGRESMQLPVLLLMWESVDLVYDAMRDLATEMYPTLLNYDSALWQSDPLSYLDVEEVDDEDDEEDDDEDDDEEEEEEEGEEEDDWADFWIPPLNWAPKLS